MSTDLLMVWSDQAGVSLAIWMSVLILVMYLGRLQSHHLLRSVGRSIHQAMRLTARALNGWQGTLEARTQNSLLSAGEDQTRRTIEREFVRVNKIISRDLSHYPTLHRQISDTVNKIEKDYAASIDSPPSPPAWLEVVAAVAAIPRNGDPAVVKILDQIHRTVEGAHADTLAAYLKASQRSHQCLSKMQPLWRQLLSNLDVVKLSVDSLEDRAMVIDQHMTQYEALRRRDTHAVSGLMTSSLTQFFISGLVLFIAVMGGLINFQLIAMPMSEMVGGTSYIGAMKTSDIAALVIILVEIAMGVFLLESLRITHLFPIIGSMDDKIRRRMMVITLVILTILATVEASLAYMRDLLALDREALTQSLAGASVVEANFRWIPSLGQMVMGFILPFALAFVAIPLESFIHALRSVLGLIMQGFLSMLAVVARLIGSVALQVCKVVIHFYDLIIMIPLSAERLIKRYGTERLGAGPNTNDIETNEGVKS